MKTITCPRCGGRGYAIVDTALFGGAFVGRECPDCDGEGAVDVPDCQEDLDELGIPASAEDLTDE